jgi:hypothetical protein
MEIRIVDFELLTRHYTNYQNGLNEIEDEKTKFLEKVEPFRKEMQNIIISTQGGIVLDNLSQEQRVQKFQSLQQDALEIIKIQKDAGVANELAVKQFEAEVLNSQGLEFEALQQIAENESKLNFLLGRFPQIGRAHV